MRLRRITRLHALQRCRRSCCNRGNIWSHVSNAYILTHTYISWSIFVWWWSCRRGENTSLNCGHHPPRDIWAGKTPDSSTRALWKFYQQIHLAAKQLLTAQMVCIDYMKIVIVKLWNANPQFYANTVFCIENSTQYTIDWLTDSQQILRALNYGSKHTNCENTNI
jgi:hypothetical protein